jgi:ribonuclease HI
MNCRMSQLNYGTGDAASNNRRNWNHVQIIHKLSGPYRLTWRARHLGRAENTKIGHCARTTERANVTVKKTFGVGNNGTCTANCNYRLVATLHTLRTKFISST